MARRSSQLAAYAVSRAIPAVISLISVPVYTSLLSPNEYGRYSLTVAAVAVADAMCFQWLVVSIVRFLPMFREDPAPFVKQITRYYLITLTAVVGGSVMAMIALSPRTATMVTLALLLLAVTAWNELNLEFARSRFRVAQYALAASVAAMLGLAVGVMLARAGMGEEAPIIGSTVAFFFTGCVFLLRGRGDFFGATSAPNDRRLFQSLLSYGGPMAAALLISSLLNASDRFLINHLLGSASVGIYAAAWALVFPAITIMGSTINLAGFPEIIYGFESQDGTLQRRVRQQLNLLLKILVPAMVGVYFLADDLAHAFLGASFSTLAATLLPGLALVAALSSLRSLYTDIAFHLSKKSGTLSLVMLTALACSLASNLVLLPKFGVRAAVWSAVLGYSVALGLSMILGRKWFKLPGPSAREIVRLTCSTSTMLLVLSYTHGGSERTYLLLRISLAAAVYFFTDWAMGQLYRPPAQVSL